MTADPRVTPTVITGPADIGRADIGRALRDQFSNGAVREPQTGRPRFDLLMPVGVPFDQQFLTRLGRHMAGSLAKYPERNWEQFCDQAALDRCRASAFRHLVQWMAGETDEDHAAAVVFNLMAAEHAAAKMEGEY